MEDAGKDFDESLRWQRRYTSPERQLFGRRGLRFAEFLASSGGIARAIALTQENAEISREEASETGDIPWRSDLLLTDLHFLQGDLTSAADILAKLGPSLRDWNVKEPLCWWLLLRARLSLQNSETAAHDEAQGLLDQAAKDLQASLELAVESGYGIYFLCLLLAQARLCLLRGDADGARKAAETVLFGSEERGTEDEAPPPEARVVSHASSEGFAILAATHPDCGLVACEGEARFLLAEALVLQALRSARRSTRLLKLKEKMAKLVRLAFRTEISTLKLYRWSPAATELLNKARVEFAESLRLNWRTRNTLARVVETRIKELKRGRLTHFPMEETLLEGSAVVANRQEPALGYDVFLSYNHDDQDQVNEIAAALENRGLKVWWDKRLVPGHPYANEIENRIKESGALAILTGRHGLSSWMKTEMNVALQVGLPRGMPIIPVVLPGGSLEALSEIVKTYQAVEIDGSLEEEDLDRLEQGIRGGEPRGVPRLAPADGEARA